MLVHRGVRVRLGPECAQGASASASSPSACRAGRARTATLATRAGTTSARPIARARSGTRPPPRRSPRPGWLPRARRSDNGRRCRCARSRPDIARGQHEPHAAAIIDEENHRGREPVGRVGRGHAGLRRRPARRGCSTLAWPQLAAARVGLSLCPGDAHPAGRHRGAGVATARLRVLQTNPSPNGMIRASISTQSAPRAPPFQSSSRHRQHHAAERRRRCRWRRASPTSKTGLTNVWLMNRNSSASSAANARTQSSTAIMETHLQATRSLQIPRSDERTG